MGLGRFCLQNLGTEGTSNVTIIWYILSRITWFGSLGWLAPDGIPPVACGRLLSNDRSSKERFQRPVTP